MKIKEFVDKYNSFANETLKEKYVKENIKNEYVPYTKKSTICENITKATTTKKVSYGDNTKHIFYSDSANRYVLFHMEIIKLYTDLEFSEGIDAIKEFELLDEYGLNDLIISFIPEREYTNFKIILDMKVEDASINENNFIQYIDTKIDAIKLLLDNFNDVFVNMIDPKVLETIKSVENSKDEDIVSFKEVNEK